jgi:hypothetical protein
MHVLLTHHDLRHGGDIRALLAEARHLRDMNDVIIPTPSEVADWMAVNTPARSPKAVFLTAPVKTEASGAADTTAGTSHSAAPGGTGSSAADRGDGRGAHGDPGGSRDHKRGIESLSVPSSSDPDGRRVHPRPNYGQVGNKAEARRRPDGSFPPWACQICGRASHRDPKTCKFRFLTQSRAPEAWGRQTGSSGGEGHRGVPRIPVTITETERPREWGSGRSRPRRGFGSSRSIRKRGCV